MAPQVDYPVALGESPLSLTWDHVQNYHEVVPNPHCPLCKEAHERNQFKRSTRNRHADVGGPG